MNKEERECYFMEQENTLLKSGASFSEWCTFISKSVYDAFVNHADLATVITSMACIETYFKTENPNNKGKNLVQLINEADFLDEEEVENLHILRKYRNSWVHAERLDDTEILVNETAFYVEAEKMAILSVRMLLTVLFSNPWI